MQAPEIDRVLRDNRALAAELGITGTPAFVIGDRLVPGAVPLGELKAVIAARDAVARRDSGTPSRQTLDMRWATKRAFSVAAQAHAPPPGRRSWGASLRRLGLVPAPQSVWISDLRS
jgi:hypothetical protein